MFRSGMSSLGGAPLITGGHGILIAGNVIGPGMKDTVQTMSLSVIIGLLEAAFPIHCLY